MLKSMLIMFIRCYKYAFSALFGNCCRFEPSCSQYAITAIERHGMIKGLYFTTRRLLCCHPWHEGGLDPVPSILKSEGTYVR